MIGKACCMVSAARHQRVHGNLELGDHSMRVAGRVMLELPGNDATAIAAWLHDLESTDTELVYEFGKEVGDIIGDLRTINQMVRSGIPAERPELSFAARLIKLVEQIDVLDYTPIRSSMARPLGKESDAVLDVCGVTDPRFENQLRHKARNFHRYAP